MRTEINIHKLLPSEATILKGRVDILTREEFSAGAEVVVCKKCKTIQLYEDTWCANPSGPCCINCKCTETIAFDLASFKKPYYAHIHSSNIVYKRNLDRIKIIFGIFWSFINFLILTVKNLHLYERCLDLSQANVWLKRIAVILIIVSLSITALFYSQKKITAEKILNKKSAPMQQVYMTNDSIQELNKKINIQNKKAHKHNVDFYDSATSLFSHNISSDRYFRSKINSVNHQIGEWID